MRDYEKTFVEYWEGFVGLDINDHDQIKRELHDFYTLIENVSIVYDYVTGGLASKPLTNPDTICSLADEHYAELYEED